MSRGGRGGARGGKALPFEVDTALEDAAANRVLDDDDDDWSKTLYPPMKVHMAPPPTAQEKKFVQKARELRTAFRHGPFFLGDDVRVGKRDASECDAFEGFAVGGGKRAKRGGRLPSLKNRGIDKRFLPKELWDAVNDGEEEGGGEATKKMDLDFLKKRRLDRLAQFDEGAEGDVVAGAGDDDDEEDANPNKKDDEDGDEVPKDDDFSENDSDFGNDYNAEKYFDDGDGADDDGDGPADEEAW